MVIPPIPHNIREQNTASLELDLNLLEGTPPTDMEGHGFWLCPTPQKGAVPWFNGYAQLYRLDFNGDRIHLKSEQFETPSILCDIAIEAQPWWSYLLDLRKLFTGKLFKFRNLGGLARFSPRLGTQNQCNTALQAFQDPSDRSWRMFATVDSGRPYEFDLTTLKPVTPVGHRDEWEELEIDNIPLVGDIKFPWIFPMNMSGAHTSYDPKTGEIFIINCVFKIIDIIKTDTHLLVWDGQGNFNKTQIIDDRTNEPVEIKQSTHQIAITQNYVIIIDTAFLIEYLRMIDPEAKAKPQSAINQVWLVPRSQLNGERAIAKHVEIPRECVHFFADYDDNNGQEVTLHLVLAAGHDVSEWVEDTDKQWGPASLPIPYLFYGSPPGVYDEQGFGKYAIDTSTSEVKSEQFEVFKDYWGVALPTYAGIQGSPPLRFENIWVNYGGYINQITIERLVKLYADHEYRTVPVEDLPRWKGAGVLRWSASELKVVDSGAVPRGYVVNTPLYVPKANQSNELEGYLVAMVSAPEGSQFWIWQAGDLAAGPIAKLNHPDVKFSFPLHSAWSPSIAPRSSSYKINLRDDMDVYKTEYFLPHWVKRIFEEVIYPAFDDR